MANERRRSDRILLTVPLRVRGKDQVGVSFSEEARSIALNRHGARIQIARPLGVGQILRVHNQLSEREARFRVVGPVAPPTKQGGEWGIECLDSSINIWAIQFPPPAEGSEPRALLECRNCHTVALLPVSLVEVEVLDTAGLISRQCETCSKLSPWGHAEKQVAMGAPAGEAEMLAAVQAQMEEAAKRADPRQHRRVYLQLPVRIRDYYGGVEITKTENVSKGGFAFSSDKNYYVGQGIAIICPYSSSGENIEVHARLVRRREVEGTERKLYGVRYDPKIG